ncbi:hypothetical protein V5799_019224 [Amblyomma americanum]|uniref:Uncharacterized protein n=1 Tax=Amblyomma americanum TaxID=6943 RepID=A0AAQ4EX52_AMBAM
MFLFSVTGRFVDSFCLPHPIRVVIDMASTSRFDAVYRTALLSKYFIKGWGKPDNIKRIFDFKKKMATRETCAQLVPHDYPVMIDKIEEHSSYRILEGHLVSPLVQYLPECVPKESHKAWFQVLLPKRWATDPLRPMCIHLAGTGDHYFWRRRALTCRPLLKENGVASIILENPFYILFLVLQHNIFVGLCCMGKGSCTVYILKNNNCAAGKSTFANCSNTKCTC